MFIDIVVKHFKDKVRASAMACSDYLLISMNCTYGKFGRYFAFGIGQDMAEFIIDFERSLCLADFNAQCWLTETETVYLKNYCLDKLVD